MMRKFACAAAIVAIGFGVAMADEFGAVISKVDGNKITFKKFMKGEQGEETTLPVTKDAKITKATKFDFETKKLEGNDPVKDGLKNETFTKIGEKGVFARLTTDADNKNITVIQLFPAFKKKAD